MFIEPVAGKKFFGREEVLGTLQKRVTDLKGGYRQNLALAGPMLSGKSSILRHFLKDVKDSNVIPIYIEMTGEDFNHFARSFMASLLYQYLRSEGQKAGNDLKKLKELCHSKIPETVCSIDEISKILKEKKEDAAYEKLLALTSIFKKETDKNCIVILDEFHNLSNFRLKKPFQVFGRFLMIQKNTMYIVSSSQKTLLKDILSKKLALLFGNFEIIDINGFDNKTARSFISDRIKDVDSCENIKKYLIYVSQGNPFYLDVLSTRFSELMKTRLERHGAKEVLLDVFSEVLYQSGGILNQYFTNNINFFLEKKSRKNFLPILLALARGKSTLKAIQADLAASDKMLGDKLKKLQEMDIICASGIFYKISERLFEYWLRYVYALKLESMIDDLDIKYLEFKNSIEKDYTDYCKESLRPALEIIQDLFKSFGNEKICVSMDIRQMPKFESVDTKVISNNVFHIIGSCQNRKWICHVKHNDIADEEDVNNLGKFKLETKDLKIARKIFIHFNGMEQNAFLLAKEQNIWVWDLAELNKILRLFGRYELVL